MAKGHRQLAQPSRTKPLDAPSYHQFRETHPLKGPLVVKPGRPQDRTGDHKDPGLPSLSHHAPSKVLQVEIKPES
jgi:hypothetical protein